MRIVHLLRAVTVSLDAFGARFAAANGLHPTDLRAIIDLLDAERASVMATPGWLGERLSLNSASVTALVDRLERAGQVRREPHPHDRRRVRLVVSPEAKALGWAFFGPLMSRVVGMLDGYGETELAVVHRFLSETAGIVADVTGPGPARVTRDDTA
ncbi:MarR family winged helix-turn-helix transcriptional regulator [Rugosimonospora africana]|nr:MarR family transcriptional regulator [Rugosimonospora africana]